MTVDSHVVIRKNTRSPHPDGRDWWWICIETCDHEPSMGMHTNHVDALAAAVEHVTAATRLEGARP